MKITFKKATTHHINTILKWLSEPHMREFWDNSQEHKDDILNFIHGKKQTYFYGTTTYWIGSFDNDPYCFILSSPVLPNQNLSELDKAHVSPSGHTITLDFGIGNPYYLGKSLAAPTLEMFVTFYSTVIDPLADTFFIDPDENNPKAKHVYSKAGFKEIGTFDVNYGASKGSKCYLMVKKLKKLL